jgi:Mg-chelatase subunit ChlD
MTNKWVFRKEGKMNDLVVFAKKEVGENTKKELEALFQQKGLKRYLNTHHDGGYVYLVIDCSGSMRGGKLEQAKRGVIDFAEDAKTKGYLCGLIQFHTFPTHLCELTKDTSQLKTAINGIELGDATHMTEAIVLAHQNLKDKNGHCVMVIATDGYPNGPGDPDASLQAAENAKREGIDIITVGTDDADRDFLGKLASKTELSTKVAWPLFGSAIALMAKKLPATGIPASEKKFLE